MTVREMVTRTKMIKWVRTKERAVAGFSMRIETLSLLRQYARAKKVSMSWVVEEAVCEYLAKEGWLKDEPATIRNVERRRGGRQRNNR